MTWDCHADGGSLATTLDDYRDVGGRVLPHRLEVRHGSEAYGTLTIRVYHLGKGAAEGKH